MTKQQIHWWDFPGKYTCHKSKPKLSFADSYLGEVFLAADSRWYLKVPHSIELREIGYSNSQKAKEALLRELGVEELTVWDR